jgi:hypothetical protein
MFILDQAIADWRRQMAADGVNTPEVLNELESHLCEDWEQLTRSGANPAEAFAAAVERIGQADILKHEFDKVGGAAPERVKDAIFTLVGIPILAANMNTTNTSIEPRWATYLKAAVFLVPAVSLWALSVVFVFPKLQQICRDAGIAIPLIYRVMHVVSEHSFLMCATVILALIGLEWRVSQWPRYRRASVGVAVFLLNSAVLILIFVMVVLALLAVPELGQHAK